MTPAEHAASIALTIRGARCRNAVRAGLDEMDATRDAVLAARAVEIEQNREDES